MSKRTFDRIKEGLDELRANVPAIAQDQEIREYHKAHPGVAQTEIAKLFNVNQGRVSEALRGIKQ